MTEIKQNLNKAQQQAVFHGQGPLLIIAGAGTGKTTVITQRVAHLILDKKIRPDAILALTFTEKAAAEMEERVDLALPYGYVDLWISTFHSFCEKILRAHGLEIGLPTDFKLLNQTDQWLLVRNNLTEFELEYYRPSGNPTKFIHALLSHFSRAKDEEVSADEYFDYANNNFKASENSNDELVKEEAVKQLEVAKAYQRYQQLLLDNSYLDFGDLVNYTLRLLKERKGVLKKLRDQFQYILVDEFQDTNYAQYELIKLLAGESANLTVVGDDDQSVYKFRGASISNILQFKKDYPKAAEVVLTENYRSCQNILDLSYNFIQLNNPQRLEVALSKGKKKKLSKKLTAAHDRAGIIRHLHADTLEHEVESIIKEIVELKKNDPELSWDDFAILVRANDSAIHFTNYLRKTQIPFNFLALKGLYTKPVILDILSYFKLLDNYHEGPAMYRVLTAPFVDVSLEDVMQLNHFANRRTISLYQALRRITEIETIKDPNTVTKIAKLLKMIDAHTKFAQSKPVGQVFVAFLQQSGILEKLLKDETEEDRMDLEYLQSFHKRLQKFEGAYAEPSLKNFMLEMNLELESGERGNLEKDLQAGPEAIKIMTIHSSKGLEFEYVFLPNMVDKKFPSMERSEAIELPAALIKDVVPDGDVHLQEERRLFYVAMTRARQGLYLASADDYGGLRMKKLSRFLMELKETSPVFELRQPTPFEKKLFQPKIEVSESKNIFQPPLPSQFSFSQIASFLKCPYQYKLSFIYRIPIFGKAVFSYGKTMHSTLEEFYKLLLKTKTGPLTDSPQQDLFGPAKLPTVGELVKQDELLAIFEKCWIDDWYETGAQKLEYQTKAIKALTEFYDKVKDRPARVKFLEEPFHLKVAGQNGDTYTIKGVIDRVDLSPDGKWQIIDYKTGSPKDKLEWEDKMQLLIYQIAAKELFNAEVESLTYYYLDQNKELSFLGDGKDVEKLKSQLVEVITAMKTSKFNPTPGWQCQFCDYRDICEFKT